MLILQSMYTVHVAFLLLRWIATKPKRYPRSKCSNGPCSREVVSIHVHSYRDGYGFRHDQISIDICPYGHVLFSIRITC